MQPQHGQRDVDLVRNLTMMHRQIAQLVSDMLLLLLLRCLVLTAIYTHRTVVGTLGALHDGMWRLISPA